MKTYLIFKILIFIKGIEKSSSKQCFQNNVDSRSNQSIVTKESDTQPETIRPRSSTVCSSQGETIKKELQDLKNKRRDSKERMETKGGKVPSPVKSPIMEM